MKWQPIETARKDRTEMLGYRPDQGVFIFRYASMEEVVPTDEHGDPLEDYEDHEGWWHDLWGWMDGWDAPTHWMLLPLPPQAQRPDEEALAPMSANSERSASLTPQTSHSDDT